MAENILIILLTIYISLRCATSQPVGNVPSFVDSLKFQYKNDGWTCGDYKCPANSFGCKIVEKTLKGDKKTVYQDFNCINKDKAVIDGISKKVKLDKETTVNIDLETYIGAKSKYDVAYLEPGDHAVGVVAVDELHELKLWFNSLKYSKPA